MIFVVVEFLERVLTENQQTPEPYKSRRRKSVLRTNHGSKIGIIREESRDRGFIESIVKSFRRGEASERVPKMSDQSGRENQERRIAGEPIRTRKTTTHDQY